MSLPFTNTVSVAVNPSNALSPLQVANAVAGRLSASTITANTISTHDNNPYKRVLEDIKGCLEEAEYSYADDPSEEILSEIVVYRRVLAMFDAALGVPPIAGIKQNFGVQSAVLTQQIPVGAVNGKP